jgi:membrane associated rhomboid family serine protease
VSRFPLRSGPPANQPPQFLVRWYHQLGPGTFGLMAVLLLLQVALWVGIRVAPDQTDALYRDGLSLSLDNLQAGRVWTLLSYGLLHDLGSPTHLLFNLLGLYFLSPRTEVQLGTRRWLAFAASAVVAGGLLQVGLDLLTADRAIVVGVSALNLALLARFAWQQPDAQVLLLFVPVKARWVVPIAFAVDLLMWLSPGGHVAIGAHAGGVLSAWLWQPASARILRQWRARLQWRWLKVRGKQPDITTLLQQAERGRSAPASKGHLRVLPGGKDRPPPSEWN